jgi:hypothetical protein
MKTRHLLALAFITLGINLNAQNPIERYQFINKYRFYSDSTEVRDYEPEYSYEECLIREYLSDSVFVEKGLLNYDYNYGCMFKVKSNNWYINNSGKWILFFNGTDSLVPYFNLGLYKYKVIWKKICNCVDNDFYRMFMINTCDSVSEWGDYYFHPKYGVVGYKSDFYTYFRKDIKSTNFNSCIPMFLTWRNFKDIKDKYGTEYLRYTNMASFCFWNNDMSNDEKVLNKLNLERQEWMYYNNFLYCLDTIKNYSDFAYRSAKFFERSFPVAWGLLYPDCQSIVNDSVSDEEFEIIKFNTIHGASLIVNSCLFEKQTNNEDYKYFLYKKYFIPNKNKRKLNDSIMNNMKKDIEWLCEKIENCK